MYRIRYKRILVVDGSPRERVAVGHRHATTHSVTLFSLRTLTPRCTAVARVSANSCESRVSSTDVARIVHAVLETPSETRFCRSSLPLPPLDGNFRRVDQDRASRRETKTRLAPYERIGCTRKRKRKDLLSRERARRLSSKIYNFDAQRRLAKRSRCRCSRRVFSVFRSYSIRSQSSTVRRPRLRNSLATALPSSTDNIFLLANARVRSFRNVPNPCRGKNYLVAKRHRVLSRPAAERRNRFALPTCSGHRWQALARTGVVE